MNREALIHQLVSVRSAIDAALAIMTEDQQPDDPQPCQHEDRTDMSTMGIERWECNVCGHKYENQKRGDDG